MMSISFLALALLPGLQAAPSIDVGADPEVDLIATIWYLADPSGQGGYGGSATPPAFTAAVAELKGEGHAAVKAARKLSKKGFTHETPLSWALRVDNDFQPLSPLPADLIEQAGGQKELDRIALLAKDFRVDTGFDAWLARHQAEWTSEALDLPITGDLSGQLESWYGKGAASYKVVVSPAVGATSYGPSFTDALGLHAHLITSRKSWNGLDARLYEELVLRELGQALVSPAVDAAWDTFKTSERLFAPVAPSMTRVGYKTWRAALIETLTRAATCRMLRTSRSEIEALECVAAEVHDGFVYVPLAYQHLGTYEAGREKYPSFETFMLDLSGIIGAILSPEDWIKRSPWNGIRSMSESIESNKLNATLVVPTEYTDSELEPKVNAHVRGLAQKLTGGRVSWDTDAVVVPPENAAWMLFGTTSTNLVLAKYKSFLPYTVSADSIVVDNRRFEGTDLRLILRIANPSGMGPIGLPKGGPDWLIYTSQNEADVIGIHELPHGPTGWVVARGKEIVGQGFFVPESIRKALPPPAPPAPPAPPVPAVPAIPATPTP